MLRCKKGCNINTVQREAGPRPDPEHVRSAGACWVLPQFANTLANTAGGGVRLISTYKDLLLSHFATLGAGESLQCGPPVRDVHQAVVLAARHACPCQERRRVHEERLLQ